jgi:Ser-tRNA(Ala) deacylase AlaX
VGFLLVENKKHERGLPILTHLSAATPNKTLPSKTPDMNVAWATSANMDRLHTKFHCKNNRTEHNEQYQRIGSGLRMTD